MGNRVIRLPQSCPECSGGDVVWNHIPLSQHQKNQLISEFSRLECQLSPENLYQDGERSRSEAARIGARLSRRQEEIISILGRAPTQEEIESVLILSRAPSRS